MRSIRKDNRWIERISQRLSLISEYCRHANYGLGCAKMIKVTHENTPVDTSKLRRKEVKVAGEKASAFIKIIYNHD